MTIVSASEMKYEPEILSDDPPKM